MKSTHTLRARIAARGITICIAAMLSACGGGGGDGASYRAALISQNAASVYTSTEDTSVWSLLKSIRLGTGAGVALQAPSLDAAARAHAEYLVLNGLVTDDTYLNTKFSTSAGWILGGHYEDPNLSGVKSYTGQSPEDRAHRAGYLGAVNEVVTFGAATGEACVASMENSVYHLIGLLSPFIEVGVSFHPGTGSGSVCVVVMGVPSGTAGQLPERDSYIFYPAHGATGVQPVFANQAEIPVPVRELSMAGHPVLFSLYNLGLTTLSASDISVGTFTLTPAGGSPVNARLLVTPGVTSSGPTLTPDTNIAGPGFIVLVPEAPLAPSTVYSASFQARVISRDLTVSRTWTFTTASH